MLSLRPYQNDAVTFLYERDRAMILAPVGAGKTAIALTAMAELMRDHHMGNGRWLVVAPKRVCTDVWPVEQKKWGTFLRLGVAVGTSAERRKIIEGSATTGLDTVVINYDNLQWLCEICEKNNAVLGDLGFTHIVFDELTRLKNPSGKRFKALVKMLDKTPVRWGLTGSFTSNGLEDVFGQCKVIDEALLGRAKGAFLQQYFVCINRDFGEWMPRKGALEQVMTRIRPATYVLEPGVYKDKLPPCHVVEMRCDLPDREPYEQMKRDFVTQVGLTEITALSAAAVTTKLQQMACIAEGTPVLTERGWVPIDRVQGERVWDGVEWVRHEGAIFQGIKETALCNGVRMTYDHNLLTVAGWKTAEEVLYADASSRFDRAAVWLPDGSVSRWIKPAQVRPLALPLRLRQRGDKGKSVFKSFYAQTTAKLRVSPRQRNALHDGHTPIQHMAQNAGPLQQHRSKGLRAVWRTGGVCVRSVERFQHVLARHAAWLCAAFDFRPRRQQWPVLAGQLPLGRLGYPSQQQEQQQVDRNARRSSYDFSSCTSAGNANSNTARADRQIRLDGTKSPEYARTYDLVNCGPRNRFVVRGKNGELLIVHNCGFIYDTVTTAHDTAGVFRSYKYPHWFSTHRFDLLNEVLEGNQQANTLIVYNFIEELAELKRRYPGKLWTLDDGPDVIERWNAGKIPLLAVHPKSAGHGLNLQGSCNHMVFLSLPWSLELYEQVVGRIHRGGQTKDVWVYVLLTNKTIDERIWAALADKRAVSDVALEELKG
jgi:hypothetical protein